MHDDKFEEVMERLRNLRALSERNRMAVELIHADFLDISENLKAVWQRQKMLKRSVAVVATRALRISYELDAFVPEMANLLEAEKNDDPAT